MRHQRIKKIRMIIRKIIPQLLIELRRSYLNRFNNLKFKDSELNTENIENIILENYGYESEIAKCMDACRDSRFTKWLHYIPIYDRVLKPWLAKQNVGILEIGVYQGGSLDVWRKYFGHSATLVGIDIDSNCSTYDGLSAKVMIGDQNDDTFLGNVLGAFENGVDIVVDDGGHYMRPVMNSFEFLFPKLNPGGVYIIEDMHTAYWPNYGGGFKKQNIFNYFNLVVHKMHSHYHKNRRFCASDVSDWIESITMYDSVIVVQKKTNAPVDPKFFEKNIVKYVKRSS